MPKMKTHKGAAKRLRVTKTGKVMHQHARMSHFLQKKSASRKRRLRQPDILVGKQARNMKRKLGV